jgi:hypothetical protein
MCGRPAGAGTAGERSTVPSLLVKLFLFLSSYAPLFVMLAVMNASEIRGLAYALVGTAIVSVVVMLTYIRSAGTLTPYKIELSSISRGDGEAMGYVVAYLLPFFTLDLKNPTSAICVVLFFMVLGVVYIRCNLIHMNPVLSCAGYHVFEVVSTEGKQSTVITKRRYLRQRDILDVVKIGGYVVLEKANESTAGA